MSAVRVLSRLVPNVLWAVPTRDPVVALTFDDGPHPATTPLLLDLLAHHAAQATFFVIGQRVTGNEAVLQRAVAEGHELGNHTMTARRSVRLGREEFAQDLAAADAVLRPFGQARYFRPASGWFTPAMLRAGHRLGYRCALGSVTTFDIDSLHPARTALRVSRRIHPGSVVVLHEGAESRAGIVEVVDRLLQDLGGRGYATVALSALAARCTAGPAIRTND